MSRGIPPHRLPRWPSSSSRLSSVLMLLKTLLHSILSVFSRTSRPTRREILASADRTLLSRLIPTTGRPESEKDRLIEVPERRLEQLMTRLGLVESLLRALLVKTRRIDLDLVLVSKGLQMQPRFLMPMLRESISLRSQEFLLMNVEPNR